MQDFGQPGGAPPPPPKKKKGGKVVMILGVILLIVGIILMVVLWPMVGYKTEDDMKNPEDGTYTVMWDISEDEWKGIKAAKDAGFESEQTKGIDGAGSYVQTVKVENGNITEASEAQKVPTMGGILGIVLLIVGIILMIVGMIMGRKAKKAAAPPM